MAKCAKYDNVWAARQRMRKGLNLSECLQCNNVCLTQQESMSQTTMKVQRVKPRILHRLDTRSGSCGGVVDALLLTLRTETSETSEPVKRVRQPDREYVSNATTCNLACIELDRHCASPASEGINVVDVVDVLDVAVDADDVVVLVHLPDSKLSPGSIRVDVDGGIVLPSNSEDNEVDVDDVCNVDLEVDDVVLLVLMSVSEVNEVDVDDVLTLPPGGEVIKVDVDGGIVLPSSSEDIEVNVDDVRNVDLDVDGVVVLVLLPVSEVNDIDVDDVLTLPPDSEIRVDVDGGIVLPSTSEDIKVDVDDVRNVEVDVDDVVPLVLLPVSEVNEVDVADVLTLPPGREVIKVDVDRGIALPSTSEDIEVNVDDVRNVEVDVDDVVVLALLPVSEASEVDVLSLPLGSEVIRVDVDGGIVLPSASEDIE
eukprot:672856-Amphidinium_carterae.1